MKKLFSLILLATIAVACDSSTTRSTNVMVSESTVVDDIKDVGLQFAAVPTQIWERAVILGKSTKKSLKNAGRTIKELPTLALWFMLGCPFPRLG